MPPNNDSHLPEGERILQRVIAKHSRLSKLDRAALSIAITSAVNIAVSVERRRCFALVREAMDAIMNEVLINQVPVPPLQPVRIVVNREDRTSREDWKRTRDQCG